MKIALVVPENDKLGFGLQFRLLAEALRTLPDTEVETFPLEVGRQPTEYYLALAEKLNASDVDVIHLPHEYSFYGGVLPKESGFWELRYLLKKPVVLTALNVTPMETLLADTIFTPAQRLANLFHFRNKATRDAIEIAPFATAYTIVATNYERGILIGRGAKPEYITVIPDGIPKSDDIKDLWKTQEHEYRRQGLRGRDSKELRSAEEGEEPEDAPDTRSRRPYEAATMLLSDFTWQHRISLSYALAHGCTIMIVRTPETQEIASRLDCLELYNAENEGEFTEKWNAVSNNQERRAVLSAQARRYAERFSFPRIAVSTRRAYAAAISVF